MNAKHILIAIDDSEASHRTVAYVAQVFGGREDVRIRLFHIPATMPPELLEHGGSEDPVEERYIEAKLDSAQGTWAERTKTDSQMVFERAQATLHQAQIPAHAVATEMVTPPPGQALSSSIIEAAQQHGCGTVVTGRESFSWLQEVFQHHVADTILQQGQGLTLWVVQ